MELTPSVWICGAAGTVLGVILAMWGTSDIPIIIATAITFGVLSGIFGFFVPWYKPSDKK
jgi:flagellar motor component MotA